MEGGRTTTVYLQQSLTRAHTVKQIMCQDAADGGKGGGPASPLRSLHLWFHHVHKATAGAGITTHCFYNQFLVVQPALRKAM